MAEKSEFKNKQKCQKSLKRKKLHAQKLPLLQYISWKAVKDKKQFKDNINTIICIYFEVDQILCMWGIPAK